MLLLPWPRIKKLEKYRPLGFVASCVSVEDVSKIIKNVKKTNYPLGFKINVVPENKVLGKFISIRSISGNGTVIFILSYFLSGRLTVILLTLSVKSPD